MTGRYDGDWCPACGSDEVTPWAVILGAREEYGYQCLACAVTWPVLAHSATDPVFQQIGHRYRASRENTDGKQEGPGGERQAGYAARGCSPSPSSARQAPAARSRR